MSRYVGAEKRGNVEAARGDVPLADVADAVEEGSRAEHHGGAGDVLALPRHHAFDRLAALVHFELLRRIGAPQRSYMGAVLDDRQVRVVPDRLLHVLLVQVSVHLRARSVHLDRTPLSPATAGPREAFSTRNWMPP